MSPSTSSIPNRPAPDRKTIIGVLASHDDHRPNEHLATVFTHLFRSKKQSQLDGFHFLFTGGTYKRIFCGDRALRTFALPGDVADWLQARSTALPPTYEGGVIILSYFISQRACSIVWPFYAPNANHWQRHENLAFMRLCDQWHVKSLMNRGSVMAWFDNESEQDARKNVQECPPTLTLRNLGAKAAPICFEPPNISERIVDDLGRGDVPVLSGREKRFDQMTVALIAHDEMKGRMMEFAIDHETELNKFGTILATGTTGREVAAATERLGDKMIRYHSGPKGGDVEIATKILYGQCDVVIFFVDPLRPHPHIEDIRVVFQACMVRDHVVMITNENHAREFMTRVVREREGINLYSPKAIA